MTACRCAAVGVLLLAAVIVGCDRNTAAPVSAPSEPKVPESLPTLRDLVPDRAGFVLAVPNLAQSLENYAACLNALDRDSAARSWIARHLGDSASYTTWMASHGVDPDGIGLLLLDTRPVAEGGVVQFACAFHCVDVEQFESALRAEVEDSGHGPIPHQAAGEWMVVGNDEGMVRVTADSLRTRPASDEVLSGLSGSDWQAVAYPGRLTAAIEVLTREALGNAPGWVRDALVPTLQGLASALTGEHPLEMTASLGEDGVHATLAFAPSEHPVLRAWLAEPDGPPFAHVSAGDDATDLLAVRLTGTVRTAAKSLLSAAAAQTRDPDAADAARTLTETLGGEAYFVAGTRSSAAVIWAVTDEARVRALARAVLPSRTQVLGVTYEETPVDAVAAGIPLAVAVGRGHAVVATDLDGAKRALEALTERDKAGPDTSGKRCRFRYSGPWPSVWGAMLSRLKAGDAGEVQEDSGSLVRVHMDWIAGAAEERIRFEVNAESSGLPAPKS